MDRINPEEVPWWGDCTPEDTSVSKAVAGEIFLHKDGPLALISALGTGQGYRTCMVYENFELYWVPGAPRVLLERFGQFLALDMPARRRQSRAMLKEAHKERSRNNPVFFLVGLFFVQIKADLAFSKGQSYYNFSFFTLSYKRCHRYLCTESGIKLYYRERRYRVEAGRCNARVVRDANLALYGRMLTLSLK